MFKWVGSKKRLTDEIIAYFPGDFQDYVEPFLGAGHVALHVLEEGMAKGHVYLSDNNPDLICFWLSLQNDPEGLMKEMKALVPKLNKRDYNVIRRQNLKSVTKQGARFYYMVKNSYRGLWRVNSDGICNVSYAGCNSETFLPDYEEMMRIHKLLDPTKVTVELMDFRDAMKRKYNKAVIYLDPPYYNTFDSYTVEKFLKHDHVVLHMLFEKQERQGHVVIESNSDEDFIRDLYKGHEVNTVNIKHNTSCTNGAEEKTEVIIH
jgi:DNA adenine methylase